jgi:hypothetical protein
MWERVLEKAKEVEMEKAGAGARVGEEVCEGKR